VNTLRIAAAIAVLFIGISEARPRHHSSPESIITCNERGCSDNKAPHHENSRLAVDNSVLSGRPSGCPARYCGCGTSLHLFNRIIPELNLASNWRKFPSASCAPGNAAWRHGHVFAIEQCNGDGTVLAFDSNSGGHLTRLHTVSLRGYHVVSPNGRWASN